MEKPYGIYKWIQFKEFSISIAALLTSNISSNGMGEVSPEFIDSINC
jgi:hypothetical protein